MIGQTRQTNNTHGFTLIELLLYLGLSVTMIAVLGGMGIHVLQGKVRAEMLSETLYSGAFATTELRNVLMEGAELAVPLPGETRDEITITQRDGSVVNVFLEDGVLMMRVNESEAAPLTSQGVVVDSFVTEGLQASSGAVRVLLTLRAGNMEPRVFTTSYMLSVTP